MIHIDKLTPEVYYKNSRDFQFLGRTLEVLANSIYTDSSLIKELSGSDNMDKSMVELLLYTLGFKPKHDYTDINLLKLAQIFKLIMRVKGTYRAIEDCIYLLLRSQDITDPFKLIINTLNLGGIRHETNFNEIYTIELHLPTSIKDTTLIEDLFDYILPAGFTYNIFFSDITITEYDLQFNSTGDYRVQYGYNSSILFSQLFTEQLINEDLTSVNRTYTTVVTNSDSVDHYNEPIEDVNSQS